MSQQGGQQQLNGGSSKFQPQYQQQQQNPQSFASSQQSSTFYPQQNEQRSNFSSDNNLQGLQGQAQAVRSGFDQQQNRSSLSQHGSTNSLNNLLHGVSNQGQSAVQGQYNGQSGADVSGSSGNNFNPLIEQHQRNQYLETQPSRCLYVGNVPPHLTEQQLMFDFQQFGEVDGLKVHLLALYYL